MQAAYEFGQTTILNKAMALAISAFIDRAELVNEEIESYKKVDVQQIQQVAKELFRKENCSTLYYKAKK